MSRTLNIAIPSPHPRQAEIEASQSKRIGVNAGRRAGKTFMVGRMMVHKANQGRKELYIAPVTDQTDAVWELCCEWLGDAILTGLVKKNETKRTLDFQLTGGRIDCKTGHNPDHLRGTWGDDIYLDEFAFQNEDVLTKIVLPMLVDTNGTLVIISTPNLRNHFYHLYLKAQQSEDWDWFTFPSHDNPYLSEEALQQIAKDMTDVEYKQEIMAEFVPGVGAVFTIRPAHFYSGSPGDHAGHRIVAGLDWGQKEDFTALSIGCATCQKELALHRMREIDYPLQREFLKKHLAAYPDVELLAESNSIGQPNIEQLWADGVDVMPFQTTNSSKAGIVHGLRLAFAQDAWLWVEDRDAWLELEAFEMKISRSGLQTFSAPEGLHDDSVIARCLMLHQATIGRFTLG